MGEENNIDKLFRSALDPLNVNPPDKSRMVIDAELDKRRSLSYRKKINNYRMMAAVLALLLLSFAAFYFMEPVINKENAVNTGTENHVDQNKNNDGAVINETVLMPMTTSGNSEEKITAKNINEINNSENVSAPVAANSKYDDAKNNLENEIAQYAKPEVNETIVVNSNNIINNYLVAHVPKSIALIPVDSDIYAIPGSIDYISGNNNASVDLSMNNNSISPLSVFLFYSPNYSYCLLKDNTPDLVDDVQMYKDQETPEFSYSTGLALRYNLGGRWGFSAGVTYSTVTKSISLLKVYATGTEENMYYAYPTSSGLIEMPNPQNTVLHEGDSLNLGGDGVKILKFVSIPLMVRYVIPKEKINWFVNGGLSVNFLVQDQARISTGRSDATVNNKTQGLKKTSYGFVVGAGLEYKLMNNFNLVLEPVYKGTFTSITEDAAVKNYPFSVGLNLGAAISF